MSFFYSDSSPLVQFQLLHSKFHLCSVPTRALILSTYVKFINPVPRDQATDPADPVFRQSVSQREPGATAEGYRVSTANYHSHP